MHCYGHRTWNNIANPSRPIPFSMAKLREETEQSDANKKKQLLVDQNAGYGYGGKFGLEKDRMDKSAMGNDYIGKVEKHESQTDHSKGFGGKFGVQSDRVDKAALGWDHVEKVEKHESQTDHSKGFGGKFGVQEDRRDKSALGWDHVEKVEKHESQVDHKTGFGGKFGVQSDRMDKSAVGFQEEPTKIGTAYTKTKPDICGAKPSSLRSKFENFAQVSESDAATRAAEQKRLREEKDRLDRERAAKDEKTLVPEDSKPAQRKGAISTGREGGIGNAINRFNQPKEEEAVVAKRSPIEIPRGAPLIVENNPLPSQVIPDVVQQVRQQVSVEERVSAATAEIEEQRQSQQSAVVSPKRVSVQPPVEVVTKAAAEEEEQIAVQIANDDNNVDNNVYDDVEEMQVKQPEPIVEKQPQQHQPDVVAATPQRQEVEKKEERVSSVVVEEEEQSASVATEEQPQSGQFSSLPANEDLSEYIEDTGVKATALYDYQAAAEDEISFDPDDLITHIEMVRRYEERWQYLKSY